MYIATYHDPSSGFDIPEVVFFRDTIWMTQTQMGILYEKAPSGMSQHIRAIYQDGELSEETTSIDDRIFRNPENTIKKPKKYYNLQVIIAVGFKINNSPRATSFRTWANTVIDEYVRTGYALDDERLKTGNTLGKKRDYDRLMDRVRAIRFDERNVYEKIKGETGLYYFRARMYSANLGRFMNRDPIGMGDSVNLYMYVGNSPVMGRDPSGKVVDPVKGINDPYNAVMEEVTRRFNDQ